MQDAIKAQGSRVWELLERGAVIYICGDAAKMLPDVKKTLVSLQETYDPTYDKNGATDWLAELEKESRFLVDAWA